MKIHEKFENVSTLNKPLYFFLASPHNFDNMVKNISFLTINLNFTKNIY